MSMTRYEKSKVAEFYGQTVADILSAYLSEAEEHAMLTARSFERTAVKDGKDNDSGRLIAKGEC